MKTFCSKTLHLIHEKKKNGTKSIVHIQKLQLFEAKALFVTFFPAPKLMRSAVCM